MTQASSWPLRLPRTDGGKGERLKRIGSMQAAWLSKILDQHQDVAFLLGSQSYVVSALISRAKYGQMQPNRELLTPEPRCLSTFVTHFECCSNGRKEGAGQSRLKWVTSDDRRVTNGDRQENSWVTTPPTKESIGQLLESTDPTNHGWQLQQFDPGTPLHVRHLLRQKRAGAC
jgi:hypothetical protein